MQAFSFVCAYQGTVSFLTEEAIKYHKSTTPTWILANPEVGACISTGSVDKPADETCSEKEPLYVVHTFTSPYGGTRAVFYPDVLKDFATKLESNLIKIPASKDESILIADTGDVDIDAIHDVLVSANDEHIADGDGAFLSDSMYYFDLESCGLFKIENESHSDQMFS